MRTRVTCRDDHESKERDGAAGRGGGPSSSHRVCGWRGPVPSAFRGQGSVPSCWHRTTFLVDPLTRLLRRTLELFRGEESILIYWIFPWRRGWRYVHLLKANRVNILYFRSRPFFLFFFALLFLIKVSEMRRPNVCCIFINVPVMSAINTYLIRDRYKESMKYALYSCILLRPHGTIGPKSPSRRVVGGWSPIPSDFGGWGPV